MKNLARGGAILAVLGLFVVFIYAQTATGDGSLSIAKDSLNNIQNNIVDNNLVGTNFVGSGEPVSLDLTTTDLEVGGGDDDDKKLVKKTVSVSGAGASRGAFSATAYCLSGRTAMGHGVRRGLIAADPRVLKLGSRVYVNAGAWSGTYLVSDIGGGIKGKKIDIWVPSCGEARRFGRRTVQVFSAQ